MTLRRLSASAALLLAAAARIPAQAPQTSTTPDVTSASTNTSNDLFVMLGSDFDRPGMLPRANYNIGVGHTFGFLQKDPFGDELTVAYSYENAGAPGFLHT